MDYSNLSALINGDIIADRHDHWADNNFELIIRTSDRHLVCPITSLPHSAVSLSCCASLSQYSSMHSGVSN